MAKGQRCAVFPPRVEKKMWVSGGGARRGKRKVQGKALPPKGF
jgi:hypothetical protein